MPVDQTRESWKPGQDWQGAIDEINYIKELAREMGGPHGVERQHRGGRYTIRERIDSSSTTTRSSRPARWSARTSTTATAICATSRRAPS